MKLVESLACLVVHVVLEMSKERFNRCIVDAISAPRHGLGHVQFFNLLDIKRVGVMETLVRMNERVLENSWREYWIVLHGFYSIEYETHLQTHREVPSHNFATCQVFHNGQIGKAVVERDVGDISGKELEGGRDVEHSIQFVLKCAVFQGFLHDHFVRVASSNLGNEMILGFDASDLFVIHNKPFFQEFHLNCPPTVLSLSSTEYLVNLQVIIMVFVGFVCLFQPCVVATSRYTGNLAEQSDI